MYMLRRLNTYITSKKMKKNMGFEPSTFPWKKTLAFICAKYASYTAICTYCMLVNSTGGELVYINYVTQIRFTVNFLSHPKNGMFQTT